MAHVLKEKWFKITGFAHSQTTNKLVNEAANDSARVSGQDRKNLPALGTNQIAGFGGFRPLASSAKIIMYIDIYIFFLFLLFFFFCEISAKVDPTFYRKPCPVKI